MRDWQVGVRVWVARHGATVLGEGRLELLEWIDRCHSISAAARQLGISYRHAWVTVQAVNEAAGEPLVAAATGGQHGGGARLTARGSQAVALCRRMQDQLQQTAVALLPQVLATPQARVIHVAAAVSLEEVLGQLVSDYALRQPEVKVRVILGASDELADQIQSGAAVDLFLSADPGQLQRLAAAKIAEPAVVSLAENSLAALTSDTSGFTARKAVDVLTSGVRPIAIASPSCPLGVYTRAYLQGLGLYEAFCARCLELENSRAVVAAVQAGQADVGFVYSSATLTAHGCRVLFRIHRLPTPIRYVGAVLRRGQDAGDASAFLDFLASRGSERRFRRWGFMPASARRKSK